MFLYRHFLLKENENTNKTINNTSFSFLLVCYRRDEGEVVLWFFIYRIEEDLIEKSLPVSRNKKFGYERQ